MELTGKTILLTGASDGIGRASALALAGQGARVLLVARSADKLRQLAAEIAAAGGQAHAYPADITSTESVEAAVAAIDAGQGGIDILVNCAGNSGGLAYWLEDEANKARDLFAVHVFGMERMVRAVLPGMMRRRRGVIVNFSSTVGWVPMPTALAYSAAKAAVNAFTAGLRAELSGSGVRIVLFAPPHTMTASGAGWAISPPVKSFPPAWVAGQLVRALQGGADRYICGSNRALLLLQRLWPWYAAYIMRFIGLKAAARLGLARPSAG